MQDQNSLEWMNDHDWVLVVGIVFFVLFVACVLCSTTTWFMKGINIKGIYIYIACKVVVETLIQLVHTPGVS